MPGVNPDILKWARETAGLKFDGLGERLRMILAQRGERRPHIEERLNPAEW